MISKNRTYLKLKTLLSSFRSAIRRLSNEQMVLTQKAVTYHKERVNTSQKNIIPEDTSNSVNKNTVYLKVTSVDGNYILLKVRHLRK